MERLDIITWRRYHLYDDRLFSIDAGTKLDKSKMSTSNPSINFVGRANANNGVTGYIDKIDGLEAYKAGNLTVSLGGEYLGSCFIQTRPFYTSQNVNVLIPKWDMPYHVKQFIATMIFKEGRTYYKAFIDELNRHMNTDFSILLPSKSDSPDWDFMQSYMQSIESSASTKLQKLLAAKNGKGHILDLTGWDEYAVSEFFDIHPTKAYKLTNAKLLDGGSTPVVVNSAYNNGIGGYTTLAPTEKGNMITFSDTVDANTIFYQEYDFVGYPHVQGMYARNKDLWNKERLLFFASMFKGEALRNGFNYGNKFRRDIAMDMHIKLPKGKNAAPDWEYMERYVKQIKKEVSKSFVKML